MENINNQQLKTNLRQFQLMTTDGRVVIIEAETLQEAYAIAYGRMRMDNNWD